LIWLARTLAAYFKRKEKPDGRFQKDSIWNLAVYMKDSITPVLVHIWKKKWNSATWFNFIDQ
jgi:hypothetical protein